MPRLHFWFWHGATTVVLRVTGAGIWAVGRMVKLEAYCGHRADAALETWKETD